jgi:hypothetical protein
MFTLTLLLYISFLDEQKSRVWGQKMDVNTTVHGVCWKVFDYVANLALFNKTGKHNMSWSRASWRASWKDDVLARRQVNL